MIKFVLILNSIFLAITASCQEGKYSSIQDAIDNIDKVKILNLSNFSDTLPSSVSDMVNLKIVRLSSLPSNFNFTDAFIKLSKNKNIEELHLYIAHSELPKEIELMKSLRLISFYGSPNLKLDKTFTQLSQLPKLSRLELKSMRIKNISTEIQQLKKLRILNLDNNDELDLTELFITISKLKIEELNLSSAKFTVVPEGITKLKHLKKLTLEMIQGKFNNKQSYTILSKIKKLKELNIQGNFFNAIDPSISVLKKLARIEVDGNCLNDEEFEKLKLYLPKTEIQNEIPC